MRYQKTLKQCNATLRQKLPPAVLQSYHPQLAEYGESIHQKRLAYFQALKPILDNLLAQLQFPEPVTLKYQAGWNLDQSFLQQLEHGIAHDYRLAHTRYGPHRADISFSTPKGRALQYLSRGQQKVLILALYLSQMQLIQAQHGHYPILLIDDIAAELDAARYQSTLQYLAQLPCQIFLSTTEFRPMTLDHNRAYPLQHFYVENGNLRMQQPL